MRHSNVRYGLMTDSAAALFVAARATLRRAGRPLFLASSSSVSSSQAPHPMSCRIPFIETGRVLTCREANGWPATTTAVRLLASRRCPG